MGSICLSPPNLLPKPAAINTIAGLSVLLPVLLSVLLPVLLPIFFPSRSILCGSHFYADHILSNLHLDNYNTTFATTCHLGELGELGEFDEYSELGELGEIGYSELGEIG